MENRIYRFKRLEKLKNNHSIFNLPSRVELPVIKPLRNKQRKIHDLIKNYGNVSVPRMNNLKIHEIPMLTSVTPKPRSSSNNQCKISKSNKSIFVMNESPRRKHVNVRYLKQDFDDNINIIKTPDDSVYSSKTQLFKNSIPTIPELIGEDIMTSIEKYQSDLLISKDLATSTRCDSKPSDSICKEIDSPLIMS